MFTHLHGHSTFSFLEAIGKPVDIVARAKELGMKGIAITDLGGMYSAIRLYQSAKDVGITPILGVELGFVFDIKDFKPHQDIGNICLLALNYEGYLNLIKMVSIANTEGIEKKAKIDFQILEKYASNIVVFFGGKESRLGMKILSNSPEEQIKELIKKFTTIVGKDQLYLEVISQEHSLIENLEKINNKVIDLANELDLGIILGNRYSYIKKEDKDSREIALAIKDVKKIYEEDRRKPAGDYSVQSEEDIITICKKNGYSEEDIQKRITTNNSILEKVNIHIDMYQSLFPVHQTPPEIQEKYEKMKDTLIEKK